MSKLTIEIEVKREFSPYGGPPSDYVSVNIAEMTPIRFLLGKGGRVEIVKLMHLLANSVSADPHMRIAMYNALGESE